MDETRQNLRKTNRIIIFSAVILLVAILILLNIIL